VCTKALTFFFQEDAAFCDHNWDVAIYVALAMFVEQGYGDIGVGYACDEGYTEDALWYSFCLRCMSVYSTGGWGDGC